MPNITEFLLARIAEDEALAQAAIADDQGHDCGFTVERLRALRIAEDAAKLISHLTPRRILAECAAKRAIVDEYDGLTFEQRGVFDSWEPYRSVMRNTLSQMAKVYQDHPDYQADWE